jgi:hypothetical protein
MPLYIKLDIRDNGRIYAFSSDKADWIGRTSICSDISVPAVLRKLAARIGQDAKTNHTAQGAS